MHKIIIIFIISLLVFNNQANAKNFDIDQFLAEKYFQGDIKQERQAKKFGNPRFCNKYVVVGNDANDGPLDYLNKSDGSVFSYCGGACFHSIENKPSDPKICKECPPKDLDCSGMCETLTCSVFNNDFQSAKILLDEHSDPNEYMGSENNGTVLQYAAGLSNLEMVKLLLDAGANPNIKDKNGYTPIWAGKDNTDIVRLLISKGADTSLKYTDNFNGKHTFTLMEYAQDWLRNYDPNSTPRQELIQILKEHTQPQ